MYMYYRHFPPFILFWTAPSIAEHTYMDGLLSFETRRHLNIMVGSPCVSLTATGVPYFALDTPVDIFSHVKDWLYIQFTCRYLSVSYRLCLYGTLPAYSFINMKFSFIFIFQILIIRKIHVVQYGTLTPVYLCVDSTDAVYPPGMRDASEQQDMTSLAHSLTDGYSQSKWVAEQLVLRAMERGLPATVYRLGEILTLTYL